MVRLKYKNTNPKIVFLGRIKKRLKIINMKKILIPIIIVIIIVLIIFTGSKLFLGKKEEKIEVLPTPTIVLPTVSEDIDAEMSPRSDLRAVTLKIGKIPKNTKLIEYEMIYDALVNGQVIKRGVNGMIRIKDEKEIERKDLTLGSCSSGGKCSYDEGVTSIDLILKFTFKDDSVAVFQKTFPLE